MPIRDLTLGREVPELKRWIRLTLDILVRRPPERIETSTVSARTSSVYP